MAAEPGLSSLLDDLRGEGEVDSLGRFTLDRAQARAKMQKFQLDDARRYVLELVQGAVLRGASKIEFEIDADDMHMHFDGAPFTREEFDDLWGSIFADGDAASLRGLRQLALGLNAALGTKPKSIVVRSGEVRLTLRPQSEDRIESDEPRPRTSIHVRQPLRPSLLIDFLRNLTGLLGEERHIVERCAYAEIPIVLDGKLVSRGLALPDAAVTHLLEGRVRGILGLVGSGPAELRLLKDGVWIDSHPLERCGPGLLVVATSAELRKDVSLAKIVADQALGQVVGLARTERWHLFARSLALAGADAGAATANLARVRSEALEFLKLRDIRKRAEVQQIAAALHWPDARSFDPSGSKPARSISLAELAALVPSEEGQSFVLRHAFLDYQHLAPEGPPIPRLAGKEVEALCRMFGCKSERLDDELARETTRVLARAAWRERKMEVALPEHRRYLLRRRFEDVGVRGEWGIGVEAIAAHPRGDGTLWLVREGCLLTKIEVPWGIPALDLAIEAEFVASDFYDDVLRNARLVLACLAVLRSVGAALPELAKQSGDEAMRALIKASLAMLVDAQTRTPAWLELAIPANERMVDSEDCLLADLEPFRDLPLFEDTSGTRRSLRELGARLEAKQGIDELDRGESVEIEVRGDVAWLGRGDRRILVGVFGEPSLRSWLPTLQLERRKRAFLARPAEDFDAVHRRIRFDLQRAGADADGWCRRISIGKIEALISLGFGIDLGGGQADVELLTCGSIDLRHHGRTLVTRVFEFGIGPIMGVAESPELTPSADWTDFEDDDALESLRETLAHEAWDLVAAISRRHSDLVRERRWMADLLLSRLASPDRAEVVEHLPGVEDLPLLTTLDGEAISLREAEAIVVEHGRLEWVSVETPGANIGKPPIIRGSPLVLGALTKLIGSDRMVEGYDRIRRQGLAARIESMPRREEAKLDPTRVWGTIEARGGEPVVDGQIGLSRLRVEGGLELELCTLGRQVQIVRDPTLPAPIEAIISDPQLPLTEDGRVDMTAKRFGQHIRRCRRAIPGLIVALAKRFDELIESDRASARTLLLAYARTESVAGPGRRETREQAWEAVRALPLLLDVWGRWHSLSAIEHACQRRGSVDVVSVPVSADGEAAKLERTILIADAPARAYLETVLKLVDLDGRWERERAAMRMAAAAPDFEMPEPKDIAWVERKAAVSGGLSAHLWIPHEPKGAEIVFVKGNKELGRIALLEAMPCAGVVTGDGLVVEGGAVVLDDKQRASLTKQIIILYDALVGRVVARTQMDANLRERAVEQLGEVQARLGELEGPGVGQALARLAKRLDEVISPSLRRAFAARREQVTLPAEVAAPPRPAEPPAAEPAPTPTPTPTRPAPPVEQVSPEIQLLRRVRAELQWARARHGSLLDQLGLDRLALGAGKRSMAVFDKGLVLQREHPLILRALADLGAGRDIDPIDLGFLVSALYTLMNHVAKEIDEEDERAFVDTLAENFAVRVRSDQPAGSSV